MTCYFFFVQLLLGDNFLKSKEEIETIVDQCKGLRILSLVGNRFESPDDFQPLVRKIMLN